MKKFILNVRPAILQSILTNLLYGNSLERRKFYFLNKYGFYMFLDPLSHLGNILINNELYEKDTSYLINKYIKKDSIFFDIGANEGFFSVLASKKIITGKIYCFEPQKNLLKIIEKNLLKNNFKNFFLLNFGIGESQYFTNLNVFNDTNTGSSSILKKHFFNTKKTKIKVKSLDQFVSEEKLYSQIDLVKIDIEGYEINAIKGMKNLLKEKKINTLLIDYHMHIITNEDRLEHEKLILSFGYKKIKTNDQNYICYQT